MSKHHSHDPLAGKRSQFTEKKANRRKLVVLTAFAAVFVILIAFGMTGSDAAFSAAAGPEIRIPISEVQDGEAKFYDYRTSGRKTIRFFVVRSSDGVYRAAADTCDVCYRAKKGYYQDGDDMVCRKCNQRFPTVAVNEIRGGCNPAGVPNRIEGDSLVIQASHLEANAHYF